VELVFVQLKVEYSISSLHGAMVAHVLPCGERVSWLQSSKTQVRGYRYVVVCLLRGHKTKMRGEVKLYYARQVEMPWREMRIFMKS